MAGEPSFFEIGVQDAERGRAFYGALFGWELGPAPSGPGFMIETGGLAGGMHGGDAGGGPCLFFRVDDMDAALARVLELGGSVEELDVDGGEENVARFGSFRLCRDDQGSPFGLHQPPADR